MPLIKCYDCGKEISDKSKTCIHCGCPIFKESVKTMKKKKWEELTNEEKINHYRNRIKEFWIGYRQVGIISGIFTIIFFTISFVSGKFLLTSFIAIGITITYLFSLDKEDKKWYERNVNKVYENEILK